MITRLLVPDAVLAVRTYGEHPSARRAATTD